MSREQNQDEAGETRGKRDLDDIEKLAAFFRERSPFMRRNTSLRNIVAGEVLGPRVNVDEAKEISTKGKYFIDVNQEGGGGSVKS